MTGLISKAALDLIIREEVSSKARYEAKYRRPEWPGASSGATIGIGYDLGQTSPATVRADWQGRVPTAMLEAMLSACGATGAAGKTAAQRIRSKVEIPWALAIAVHEERVVPRWVDKVRRALPNTDQLSPDCLGALVSLTFNRGPSFSNTGARYAEMRRIKAHMTSQVFERIPPEFRSMKRLWPTLPGLQKRREAEARLFEKGLKFAPAPAIEPTRPPRPDPIDWIDPDEPATPAPATPAPLAGEQVRGDPELFHVQRRLKDMSYNPGGLDGTWGGMSAGAITGFLNDRAAGIPAPTSLAMFRQIRDRLEAEIGEAETEDFKRPVTDARANADQAKVEQSAPEIVPVRRNFLTAIWGSIVAFVSAVYNTLSEYIAQAWNFFTDHKDDIPAESGFFGTVWGYVTSVPIAVWLVVVGAGLVFVAINSKKGMNRITESVQTGARP